MLHIPKPYSVHQKHNTHEYMKYNGGVNHTHTAYVYHTVLNVD